MQKTPKIYGNLPEEVGSFQIDTSEMMFWLYCPVKVPGTFRCIVPANLEKYWPILLAVMEDSTQDFYEKYVYITAKTLYVTPDSPGNRPGWHSDGFLTDDTNYVWSDSNPTVFYCDGDLHQFTNDHQESMVEMENLCEDSNCWVKYDNNTLLRLDQTVLHKVNTNLEPGMRTFVKISLSSHPYALEGNSINHELSVKFDKQPRSVDRNCPITGGSK